MDEFVNPGEHSKVAGVRLKLTTLEVLKERENVPITNGVVIEVYSFLKNRGITLNNIIATLYHLEQKLQKLKISTILSRIDAVLTAKKRLSSKKKLPGIKTTKELLSKIFNSEPAAQRANIISPEFSHSYRPITRVKVYAHRSIIASVSSSTPGLVCELPVSDAQNKDINFMKYKLKNEVGRLQHAEEKVKKVKEMYDNIVKRNGHYSIKNVNKRDNLSKQKNKLLRNAQRTLNKKNVKVETLKKKAHDIETQLCEVNCQNKILLDKIDDLTASLVAEKCSKIKAQKNCSKYKSRYENCEKERKLSEKDNRIKLALLTDSLKEKDILLSELNEKLVEVSESVVCAETKVKRIYSDKIRLCVIRLCGLEVAVEKVSPTISAVAETLFDREFAVSELPSCSTVQAIIDEGQYITKVYLSERLADSSNWGISRDGTTRKKQKILDTSVTFDNGEVASLGFKRVARETAQTIQDITKSHLEELSSLQLNTTPDTFIVDILERLSFTMSDRASNEKLADKLLDEWRDNVLEECDSEAKSQKVFHFHCMAHVLLGFHKYIADDLKLFEKGLGPLGRDELTVFKYWSKTGTIMERVAYSTSETFGPVGNHHGLRDQWEAYCVEKGVKSKMSHYKDNRFNALFKTASDIIVHRDDFLYLLEKAGSKPNRLLQAVRADLSSPIIHTLLIVLSWLYVRVTGPYWSLITSGKVSYLELSPHIQKLLEYLKYVIDNPLAIADAEHVTWISDDYRVDSRYHNVLDNADIDDQELFKQAVSKMCTSMKRTIEKQLIDFLPEKEFSADFSENDMKRTNFSQVTNNPIEHHFGDLDSSQKRRPSASFHHHTSVQLLKRNRTQLSTWYNDLEPSEVALLWKNARKYGPELRKKHREEDKSVQKEIYEDISTEKKRKRNGFHELIENNDEPVVNVREMLPKIENVSVNDYVIVAYQDRWYPGCVLKKSENAILNVKFMKSCNKDGMFIWPHTDDVQDVKGDFILSTGMIPDCLNSGRQWYFPEFEKYQELYDLYASVFF